MIGRQVVSSLKWLVSARMVGQAFAAASGLVVIRILDPRDYGLMAMASVVLGLIVLLNEMGLGAALVQQRDLGRREMEQVFGLLLLVNLGLYGALFAAAPLVGAFFGEPRVVPIVRVLALRLPLIALLVVPRAMLRREMLFRRKSLVDLAGMLAGSLTTLTFALLGHGVWALVFGILGGGVAEVIGTYLASRVWVRPRFSLHGMRRQATFGGLLTADRILWYLYTQSDVLIVGRVLGNEVLGVYSVAKKLASTAVDRLGGVLNEVGFSAYSKVQGDRRAFRSHYCKAARLMSFFSFPVFFGISAIAPDAVPVILGDKWSHAVVPLQLLALVVPLRKLNAINTPALLGIGRPGVNVVNLLFAMAIMPAAFLAGTRWGVTGVALAWVCAYPVYFGIMLRRSLPVLGVAYRDYFAAVFPSVLTGAAMYAVVALSRLGLAAATMEPVVTLLLGVATGVTAYLCTTLVANRVLLREVISLIRR
ncbi:MAG: lipopolysaccharide biosynthesis protein [Deferrisomatales bacterium]|nr:lipopolysaccharide biosynthesis protein [Deferrisomatales bacterium]